MKRNKLTKYLNELLECDRYKDYGPNGLQIEGTSEINKVGFAVSATRESVELAVAENVDALICHHGLFWKFHGSKTITGTFGKRVIPLIKNDINLYGFHLPLDAHPILGNAAQLATSLGATVVGPYGSFEGEPTGVEAKFDPPLNPAELKSKAEAHLNKTIIHAPAESEKIERMGIITGGANNDWPEAARRGMQAYMTGEISEYNWHDSIESNVHFFAGGHHATERGGVLAIKSLLEKEFNLECVFFDSLNLA